MNKIKTSATNTMNYLCNGLELVKYYIPCIIK